MPLLFVFLAFLTVFAPSVWADNPEEMRLLWDEEGPYADGDWGKYYCCIGDQNGDGCDDILYTTDCYSPDPEDPRTSWDNATNRVCLRFCGEAMGRFPDMRIAPYHEYESMGKEICFIGDLVGNGSNVFGITSWLYYRDYQYSDRAIITYIYLGGEHLDVMPDYTIAYFDSTQSSGLYLVPSNDHPCDVNGDGYDDLLMRYHKSGLGNFLRIYYGGADFDTIPDFQVYHGRDHFSRNIFSGYDLNNDGCDDLLLHDWNTFRFYFGGSPPRHYP